MTPHVLLWDIDGTLLTTKRAGVGALEDAVRHVLGREPDLTGLATAGLTDYQVAAAAIEHSGGVADTPLVRRFLRVYEAQLPVRLPERAGHPLPGVRDILDAFAERRDVVSLLLTGNTERGAAAKLRHYELDGYFDGGAFCTDAGDRADIARRAVMLAEERVGAPYDPDRSVVIGDTPHDIRCAREIGARCVVVAGSHSATELEQHDPWLVLDAFPEPSRFADLLGLS